MHVMFKKKKNLGYSPKPRDTAYAERLMIKAETMLNKTDTSSYNCKYI